MSTRRAQKEETRSRILDAAVALFESDHEGEVKLKDIAARAHVSIPTLLFHFGSRLQLLIAVGEALIAKAQQDWPEPGLRGGTVEAIERYLNPRHSNAARAVWRIGDEVTWLSPETTEPYAARFRERFLAHLANDGFADADAQILADLLAPALMMVSRRVQVNRASKRLARDFVKAATLLLEGWRPAPKLRVERPRLERDEDAVLVGPRGR